MVTRFYFQVAQISEVFAFGIDNAVSRIQIHRLKWWNENGDEERKKKHASFITYRMSQYTSNDSKTEERDLLFLLTGTKHPLYTMGFFLVLHH